MPEFCPGEYDYDVFPEYFDGHILKKEYQENMSGTISIEQIESKYAKFDKEDEEKFNLSLNKQLSEEKKKNKELNNALDDLSKLLLDKYKRINELNDIIQGYKNTLKSVGLIIGSVKSKEFPNQGVEVPTKGK